MRARKKSKRTGQDSTKKSNFLPSVSTFSSSPISAAVRGLRGWNYIWSTTGLIVQKVGRFLFFEELNFMIHSLIQSVTLHCPGIHGN